MSKIKVLDISLANQIAAGEVVERPSSVVKELVENAIDAQAKKITVRIKDAGRSFIAVEDDGIGMNQEDAKLAFERHATSKISTTFDLFRIKTLGFRGEALPSISAVADVELITSTGEGVGTKINVSSESYEVEDAPLRKGTTITVRNLFYNTPARLKHLKNDYIENANNLEVMQRISLANPSVAFTYINEDRVVFETTGRGDLLEVIYNLFGSFNASKMVEVKFDNPDFSIYGFIGKAEIAKSNRYQMITLLNGRHVFMPKVNRAIIDAYKDFLPTNRYPFVILNFKIDPALVDVNVHPSKKEVRFSKEEDLRKQLLNLIPATLSKEDLSFSAPQPKRQIDNKAKDEEVKQLQLDFTYGEQVEPKFEAKVTATPSFSDVEKETPYVEEPKDEIKDSLKRLRAIAQLQLTYIIAESDDGGFYLIDQHAANERINYEAFMKDVNKGLIMREPLIPELIDIPLNDQLRLNEEKFETLTRLGIKLEHFGGTTYKISQVPVFKEDYDEKVYVEDVLNQLLHSDIEDFSNLRHYAVATMACKASVRANERLDLNSMQYLLDNLLKANNPYTCPHGRPTIIHFSKYELEKMFKRTGT